MHELESKPTTLVVERKTAFDDTSLNWLLGFMFLAAVALTVGAFAMWNNTNNQNVLRQQALEMQQDSIQQQQSMIMQQQNLTSAQQAALQAKQAVEPAPTNVVVTDGLNGGAGPGSPVVTPPVLPEPPAVAQPPLSTETLTK